MKVESKRIVLCKGIRTPIGHLSKSLAGFLPEELMRIAIESLIKQTALDHHLIDGVMVGWVGQGSHAPNIARVTALQAKLPIQIHAFTVQANCVSGIESICSAARHILLGEGGLYLAGGTESMSNFPYVFRGSRKLKELRSLDTLVANWSTVLENKEIALTDCIEEGLTDPVEHLNMAATAEVCAQIYGATRPEEDEYAYESYKRALEGEEDGFYSSHIAPLVKNGETILEKDEYPYLRESLVKKKEMIAKAPLFFDSPAMSIKDFYKTYGKFIFGKEYREGESKATVTLFNSCARSDGAAVFIVTTDEIARKNNLEIMAEIKNWSFYGVNPAVMGIGPVYATLAALKKAELKFEDLDYIEVHEAFAATNVSIFKLAKSKYNQDWEKLWRERRLNHYGGSIALGHPLAATGTRIILNLVEMMKRDPSARYGLATACASGGLGGAIILEKYK
ncbi:MAG: thiolase family protein [Elusimicrobiota bacterium]